MGGSLFIDTNPLALLPPGLVVGGALDINHTRIRQFPKDMQVGGLIFPPSGLDDIQAFMATRTATDILFSSASHHQKMAIMDQLKDFPDLMQVAQRLGKTYALELRKDAQGTVVLEFLYITRH